MWLLGLFQRGKKRHGLWAGHDTVAKAEYLVNQVQDLVPPGARHLDIACGKGEILCAFNGIGCSSVGFELSERDLRKCRQRDLPVVRADMTADLPFKARTFDLVTLVSVLEHVAHPSTLVDEINRVLSLDGLIMVQIPNPRFPIDLHYLLPFYGFLPASIQKAYRSLVVGPQYGIIDYHTNQLSKGDVAEIFGCAPVRVQDTVYPRGVAPNLLKPFYDFYTRSGLHHLFPTGHLLVFQNGRSSTEKRP